MVFSIFIELCNHHHYLISEYFRHLKKWKNKQKNPPTLYLLAVSLHPLLSLSRQPLIYFVSVDSRIVYMS